MKLDCIGPLLSVKDSWDPDLERVLTVILNTGHQASLISAALSMEARSQVSPNGHIWVTEECPPGLWQAQSSGAAGAGSGRLSSPRNARRFEADICFHNYGSAGG